MREQGLAHRIVHTSMFETAEQGKQALVVVVIAVSVAVVFEVVFEVVPAQIHLVGRACKECPDIAALKQGTDAYTRRDLGLCADDSIVRCCYSSLLMLAVCCCKEWGW